MKPSRMAEEEQKVSQIPLDAAEAKALSVKVEAEAEMETNQNTRLPADDVLLFDPAKT